MFFQIVQLFYPLLIASMPVLIGWWSRRFHKGMTGLRLLVANNDRHLRQIRRITWAVLFSFLTSRVLMNDRSVGVTVCLLFCLLLCREQIVHKVIVWFTGRTNFLVTSVAVVACAALPQLYTVSMTLALLLLAAWCYPSQKMIDRVRKPELQAELFRQMNAQDTHHPMNPKSRILYSLYERN